MKFFFRFTNLVLVLCLSGCLAQNYNEFSPPNAQFGSHNQSGGRNAQSTNNIPFNSPPFFNPNLNGPQPPFGLPPPPFNNFNPMYGNQPFGNFYPPPQSSPTFNPQQQQPQPQQPNYSSQSSPNYSSQNSPNYYPNNNVANQNSRGPIVPSLSYPSPIFNLYHEFDFADNKTNEYEGKRVYDLKLRKLNGELENLNDYQDKCLLIVNTASTSIAALANMIWLNEIYNKHNLYLNHTGGSGSFSKEEEEKNKLLKDNLKIIAVPSNTFGEEPLRGEALVNWFRAMNANYVVLEPTDLHHSELYAILGDHAHLSVYNNFNKYLVWKNASHVELFSSTSGPEEVGSRIKNGRPTLTGKLEECISQQLRPSSNIVDLSELSKQLNEPPLDLNSISDEYEKKTKRNFLFNKDMKMFITQSNLTSLERGGRFRRGLRNDLVNYDLITDDDQYIVDENDLNRVHKLHLAKEEASLPVNEKSKQVNKRSLMKQLKASNPEAEVEGEEMDPFDQVDDVPKRRGSRRSAPKRKRSGRRRKGHRHH